MIRTVTLALERVLLPLALWAFLCALGITKIIEPDTFWHITAGDLIARQHAIPRTDPFTFTLEGEPWRDTEWLTQIIFSGIHALGGPVALTLVKACIVSLAFFILFVHWRRSPIVTFSLILCIALASRMKFYERPQIFTYLFLSIFVIVIDLYKEGKNDRPLALPLIMVPWSNLHPGCIFGLAYYGIVLLGEAAKTGLSVSLGVSPGTAMPWRRLTRFFSFFLLTALATLVNVNTYHIYSFLITHIDNETIYRGNLAWGISEFLPLSFSDTFTFFPLLLLIVLSALLLTAMIINRREIDVSSILPIIAFVLPALLMRRFVVEFFIVSVPAFLWALRSLPFPPKLSRFEPSIKPAVLVLLLLVPGAVYLHLQRTDYYHLLGLGFHKQYYPSGALRFIEEKGIGGNMFNSQNLGGALLYTAFPKRKVFSDTRLFSYEKIFPRLVKATRDPASFDMLLSMYKVDSALVESEKGGRFIAGGLFPQKDWALVYWDDFSEVFVRRIKKYTGLIAANEYRTTNSETILTSSVHSSPDPEMRKHMENELRAVLTVNPDVSKAWYALGILHGNSDQAVLELNRALKIEPSMPEAHQALARIYHVIGRPRDAFEQYSRAFNLMTAFGAEDREMAPLLNEMGTMCLILGERHRARSFLKKALAKDPTNPAIRENLRSLRALKGK